MVKSSRKTGCGAPIMTTYAQYSQDQTLENRATTESNHEAVITQAGIQSVRRVSNSQHKNLKAVTDANV